MKINRATLEKILTDDFPEWLIRVIRVLYFPYILYFLTIFFGSEGIARIFFSFGGFFVYQSVENILRLIRIPFLRYDYGILSIFVLFLLAFSFSFTSTTKKIKKILLLLPAFLIIITTFVSLLFSLIHNLDSYIENIKSRNIKEEMKESIKYIKYKDYSKNIKQYNEIANNSFVILFNKAAAEKRSQISAECAQFNKGDIYAICNNLIYNIHYTISDKYETSLPGKKDLSMAIILKDLKLIENNLEELNNAQKNTLKEKLTPINFMVIITIDDYFPFYENTTELKIYSAECLSFHPSDKTNEQEIKCKDSIEKSEKDEDISLEEIASSTVNRNLTIFNK